MTPVNLHELTREGAEALADMIHATRNIGEQVAAGLIDPMDDAARLAERVSRFDELVLSWVFPSTEEPPACDCGDMHFTCDTGTTR